VTSEKKTREKPQDDPPRVLVADDEPHVVEALRMLLRSEGFQVVVASSPAEVLATQNAEPLDAVLIDANYARDTTSGAEGLALLEQISSRDANLPVILMSAWGSIELAVAAMRGGARDFVQKPWENARLLSVLRTQIELRRALDKTRMLEAENALLRSENRPTLIASSASMRPVLDLIARIGPSEANVLVTGEHGTGKEVVAQTLHALSQRAQRSLIAVNTGALPEGTFESELFGHVKGAFTDARADRIGRFELANKGTLFLDEIANIPPRQQARLLRVLETGQFERVGSSTTHASDVRLISATNADLAKEVQEGRFREDLLFRVNTVELRLPPLRERREDIMPLAAHFLVQHSARYRRALDGFSPAALQLMQQHTWPGNVREMNHMMERAVLMARGSCIEAVDLGLTPVRPAGGTLDELSLDSVESLLVRKALARTGGNISQTAQLLGLSRGALYRRMEKHGIQTP
jgi:DNA-binding NtrC family response regulator